MFSVFSSNITRRAKMAGLILAGLWLALSLSGCGPKAAPTAQAPAYSLPPPEETAEASPAPGPALSGKSYVVKGHRYHLLASAHGYAREGLATWYGPRFHGRKTASGERFDQHKLTAAHKTLPFGSRVEVRNLNNNRTVIVRINDRGPFHPDYLIDLSRGAAQKIGLKTTARVAVRGLPD